MAGPRSSLRLLFDESLPWTIASDLRKSGYEVSWVGRQDPGVPDRSAPDTDVLRYATEQRLVVVTSDRGLVLACIERCQSVIWICPYGRQSRKQLKRSEKRRLIVGEINRWAEIYAATSVPICIRVLATESQALSLKEAALLLRRQKRTRNIRRRTPHGPKDKPSEPNLPFQR